MFNTISQIIKARNCHDILPATEIMRGLFIGDAASGSNPGFDAIVNCAPHDCVIAPNAYIDYMDHNILDGLLTDKVKSFIDRNLAMNRKVLIYCVNGDNISASVGIAYYMTNRHVDLVSAVEHCFARRPTILSIDYFVRLLIEFDEKRRVAALQDWVKNLEQEVIKAKRKIAVLTLDCNYEELTLSDLDEMKTNGQKLVNGVTSTEKSKKYSDICAKYDKMKTKHVIV